MWQSGPDGRPRSLKLPVSPQDFPTGNVKLELKTVTPNGVVGLGRESLLDGRTPDRSSLSQTFTVNGAKDNKSGAIAGDLKAK